MTETIPYVEPRLNAYLHAQAMQKGIPLAGNFELTPCCNLSCRMCYVRRTPREVEARGGLLNAETWLGFGREAAARGMLFVLLTGGEPLTHPAFRQIYTGLMAEGLMLSLNTNGTCIGEEMLQFLRDAAPTRINLSLYGASRAAYGRLCGEPEAYDRAVWALKALCSAGLSVKVNLSVTPWNVQDVDAICKIAEDCGAQIQPACYMFPPLRRETSFSGSERFTPEEAGHWKVFCDRLCLSPEQFRANAEHLHNGLPAPDAGECMELPTEHIRCRAGSSSFWMTWDGKMTPCGMMPYPAADARKDGFAAAWEATREATRKILLPPKCTACAQRFACTVCPSACLTETGQFTEAPEYLCAMTTQVRKETEEEYLKMKKEEVQNHADKT